MGAEVAQFEGCKREVGGEKGLGKGLMQDMQLQYAAELNASDSAVPQRAKSESACPACLICSLPGMMSKHAQQLPLHIELQHVAQSSSGQELTSIRLVSHPPLVY